ncbi:MAG TPA: biotin/lipoyl-binding protein [Sediminispirochaeta sp.]|nr:biotin/lipoyl-binding protein [Sediminispirochaeta sp.]
MKKRVEFMVTAFRDGFQSVYGARVFTKDFLPAVEAAVDAGIDHFEAGGGARFQSLYFYANEDAFDMMDQFRQAAGPEANLQTLARGVNVVGLDSQPRDIIDLHAKLFKKHGITTIRNFDALNDVNNLTYSGERIVAHGLKHEVVITMMELPPEATGAHTPEFYIGVLKQILDAGIEFDSVCFKDASGTSVPSKVYETIRQARQMLGEKQRIVFHSHETAGTSVLAYKAAIEAGADQIDLSMVPVSGGTAQPDVITMWHALRGTEYDLGVDIKKIEEAEEVFKECMKDYFMPPEAKAVEPLIPFSPMPGGALTANTQMMRDNGILDKYHEVAGAMGEVIERGGYGTSVTPVSQFYFQQAFNNVMIGPWKKIAEGYGKMVLGYFGKTPVEPDPEIVKLAAEQLGKEPTTEKVVDINDRDETKGIEAARKMLKAENLEETEENIFIAATCKEKGIQYLKGEARTNVRKIDRSKQAAEESGAGAPSAYTVTVNNTPYTVKLENGNALVNGVSYSVDVKAADKNAAPGSAGGAASSGETHRVEAPMPGLVLRIEKNPGESVQEGDLIMVMEAMKMENEIHAPASGTIREVAVKQGDQLKAGDLLAVIS